MLSHPEFSDISQGRKYEPSNGDGFQYRGRHTKFVYHCPIGMPVAFREPDYNPPGGRGPRTPPAKKYGKLFEEAEQATISNSTLTYTFRQRMNERALCYSQEENGEGFMFRGMVKGCPEYNKRLEEKIKEKSGEMLLHNTAFYFLTITYAPALHGYNIVEAWQIFNQQLYPFMHSIKRKFNASYCSVLEATFKGYPHAHIVLGLPRSPDIKHARMKGGKEIKYGQVFDFIRARVPSPVWNLQKADVKGLEGYLCKYVAKGMEKANSVSESGQDKLPKEERKALLSCLMPVLAQTRQVRSSIKTSQNKPVLADFLDPETLKRLEVASEIGIWDSQASAALISLINNLTMGCRAHVWAIFKNPGKKAYEQFQGYHERSNTRDIEDFKRSAYPLGCPGCVVTQFLDEHFKRPQSRIPRVITGLRHEAVKLKANGEPMSSLMAMVASVPEEHWVTITEAEKKDLSDMGIVVNINHIEFKPEIMAEEENS
jgi:hypothetical protein